MPDAEERGDVRFEIRADVTAQRHFCFTAQTRSAPSIGMGRSGFDPRGDRSSRPGRIRADGSGESLEETADGNSDSLDMSPLPEGSE
jgi:hypothetical protein